MPIPSNAFPGGYVVTLKGLLPNGVHFTRLAMYSFRADGTFRQDFWYWPGNAPAWSPSSPGDYGSTGQLIGYANQPSYPYNFDQNKYIQGSIKFSGPIANVTTLFGTWSTDTESVTINMGESTEVWRVTWSSENLIKIELQSTNYTSGALYLQVNGSYNANAVNAGWGFGGYNIGFTNGKPINDIIKNLNYGKYIRHNANTGLDEPVNTSAMSLASVFLLTNTNSLRYVNWDNTPGAQHHVFSYLGKPPGSTGSLSTRTCYQISHDFNNDGHIADNVGHTYSGLQVIDQVGNFRGFVFSDSSVNSTPITSGDNNIISSLYFLDTDTN